MGVPYLKARGTSPRFKHCEFSLSHGQSVRARSDARRRYLILALVLQGCGYFHPVFPFTVLSIYFHVYLSPISSVLEVHQSNWTKISFIIIHIYKEPHVSIRFIVSAVRTSTLLFEKTIIQATLHSSGGI